MRPILRQVNSTLGGAGAAARDDRRRRVSRYSARSITIAFFAAVPVTHIYSERGKFSLRLRVNLATFSVNCRWSAQSIGSCGLSGESDWGTGQGVPPMLPMPPCRGKPPIPGYALITEEDRRHPWRRGAFRSLKRALTACGARPNSGPPAQMSPELARRSVPSVGHG